MVWGNQDHERAKPIMDSNGRAVAGDGRVGRDREEGTRGQGQGGLPNKSIKSKADLMSTETSNCRLPASRPPPDSSIPSMMYELRLGLVR